jgi:UDP-N-acetylglucosamine diphosphorylase/glucosamine-1-phosphate N-acetyltransferase
MTKNYILFDDNRWYNLLPFTFTRPVSEIRIGILTIHEKWEYRLNASCSYLTQGYLTEKYPMKTGELNIFINSSVCPNSSLVEEINQLKAGEQLVDNEFSIALCLEKSAFNKIIDSKLEASSKKQVKSKYFALKSVWEIFQHNGAELNSDFQLLTAGKKSFEISKTNNIINAGGVFAEPGAKLEFVTLNATNGPIYLGKETEIMEGTVIRGPFALCEHSQVKMSAKIYGPTTIGPYSKVGGEINNSVFFGFSNKAHDGFLGNSVIGEWCNIGAGTEASNLKNNYAPVKLWNYPLEKFENTGLQFCGLMMADHSKCGINTMFNTGTVVGVSANIFGAGYPRNFIPSFSWGGAAGYSEFSLSKAYETAERVMERRNLKLSDADKKILAHVFEITRKYRNFK